MIHKYKKKWPVIVEAEQFDGSFAMAKKYGIHDMVTDLNLYLPTDDGDTIIDVGDWVVTNIASERHVISDETFRLMYERCD